MKLYRVCSQDEVEKIRQIKCFDDIGSKMEDNLNLNTHHYLKNLNYMHFFLKEDSLFYYWLPLNGCICVYDIPEVKVKKYLGVGKYPKREGNISKEKEILECAIPSCQMTFDYLEKVYLLNNYLTYQEYLNGNFNHFLELIYQKEETKMRKSLYLP